MWGGGVCRPRALNAWCRAARAQTPALARAQDFATRAAGGAANVSALAKGMASPLDELAAVIAARVDPPGLRADLARVGYFLDQGEASAAHWHTQGADEGGRGGGDLARVGFLDHGEVRAVHWRAPVGRGKHRTRCAWALVQAAALAACRVSPNRKQAPLPHPSYQP